MKTIACARPIDSSSDRVRLMNNLALISLCQSLMTIFIKHWLTVSLGIVTYLTIITVQVHTPPGTDSTIDCDMGKWLLRGTCHA